MARFNLPVAGRISQGFGANPDYYKSLGQVGHNGIDIAANSGTEVRAAADGTVVFEGWGKTNGGTYSGWFGNAGGIAVLIDHGDVWSGYAHLKDTVVNNGQRVTKGQLIGHLGQTGLATGPHTHFEVLGKPINFNNGYAGRINPNPYITDQPTSGGSNKDMTPNFIKRTYLAVQGREPSQGEIDFHMAKSNPESFINGFGENFLWKAYEAQRNALQTERDKLVNEKNGLIAERDGLNKQIAAEKAKSAGLATNLADATSRLDTANARIKELEAAIVEKDKRIAELEANPGTPAGQPLDNYSLGELLVAAFKKTFKIK